MAALQTTNCSLTSLYAGISESAELIYCFIKVYLFYFSTNAPITTYSTVQVKKCSRCIPSDPHVREGESAPCFLSTTNSTMKHAWICDASVSTNSQPLAKIWWHLSTPHPFFPTMFLVAECIVLDCWVRCYQRWTGHLKQPNINYPVSSWNYPALFQIHHTSS